MTDRYNDPWYLELGKRLGQARRAHRWTLPEAAARTEGLTSAAISSWERGDRHPNVKVVVQLAAVYNVPLADLIPDDTREPMTAQDRFDRICHDLDALRSDLPAPLPVRTPGTTWIPQPRPDDTQA